MRSFTILTIMCILTFSVFSQEVENKKARKLSYNDFVSQYAFNDTSAVIIELYFDKKDLIAVAEMSFLPLTFAIFPLSPTISFATSLVSFPFFIHGSFILIKYSKRNLRKVLTHYKETKELPRWLRKKSNRMLYYHQNSDTDTFKEKNIPIK